MVLCLPKLPAKFSFHFTKHIRYFRQGTRKYCSVRCFFFDVDRCAGIFLDQNFWLCVGFINRPRLSHDVRLGLCRTYHMLDWINPSCPFFIFLSVQQ